MEELINDLFAARDLAHKLHLSTKSFARHLALGDLYDALTKFADDLTEVYQGKYGLMDLGKKSQNFEVQNTSTLDPLEYVSALARWAEGKKEVFHPEDSHLINMWDEVITQIYKSKYKIEHLS